jgi:hypothetical protein
VEQGLHGGRELEEHHGSLKDTCVTNPSTYLLLQ